MKNERRVEPPRWCGGGAESAAVKESNRKCAACVGSTCRLRGVVRVAVFKRPLPARAEKDAVGFIVKRRSRRRC